MAKTNRTCKVCGLEYYFCPACSATKANPQPKWKINYCGENCKTIFDTVVKYNCGTITKDEASDVLSKCDLSKINEYDDDIKLALKDISGTNAVKESNDEE